MAKSTVRAKIHQVTFNEYKSIAEDLEERLEPRFQLLETKIDALKNEMNVKFDSLNSQIKMITWLIPLVITFIMGLFTILNKIIK